MASPKPTMSRHWFSALATGIAAHGGGSIAQALALSAGLHAGLLSALFWMAPPGAEDTEVQVVMRRGQIVVEATYSPGQPELRPEGSDSAAADVLEAPPIPIVVEPERASIGDRHWVHRLSSAAAREPTPVPTPASEWENSLAEAEISIAAVQRPAERTVIEEVAPPVAAPQVSPRKAEVGPPQPAMPELAGGDPVPEGIDDVSLPSLEGNAAPTYPPAAYRDRLEGTTTLRLHISALGAVSQVEIVHSSGHAILDEAAVNAARRFRAVPARQRGRAVDRSVKIEIQFRL